MFELQGALGASSSSAQSLPGLQGNDVMDGKNISEGGKRKMKSPKCFEDLRKCPEKCALGGWNDGYCGAQHITKDGKECGDYQIYAVTRKEAIYKCTKCKSQFTI